MSEKLFDYCLGNPPYNQEFSKTGNQTYAAPVYNEFIDAAYEVADCVELIHPARFLFNAGSTPKQWNRKMLQNTHLKVLKYDEDATNVFRNTDIKGGIAVTCYNMHKEYGAINVFTKYHVLNDILHKVVSQSDFQGMKQIVITRTAFRLTPELHHQYSDAIDRLSEGHPYDMSTNIFERLPNVFLSEQPVNAKDYIRILGRINNNRVYKWIRKDFVSGPDNLFTYKVFLPSANGNGSFGEIISSPVVGFPFDGATETFISVGVLKNENEAEAVIKYIATKFVRAMLGVIKTTQHLTPEVWKYVPLQDFTSSSDIDWSKSIHEIDLQLYQKYGLSVEEINFIEQHVKEMT